MLSPSWGVFQVINFFHIHIPLKLRAYRHYNIKLQSYNTLKFFWWSSSILGTDPASNEKNDILLEVWHICPNILWALPHRMPPIFHFILMEYSINATLKYLFISACKATQSHCDYNRHHLIISLYYLCKLNIDLNLRRGLAGIWTQISRTQSGYEIRFYFEFKITYCQFIVSSVTLEKRRCCFWESELSIRC